MKSMTGFGQAKISTETSQIEVSVRTVNGRFLETRFHLPREFIGCESDLRQILAKHFSRGTIDVFVNRKIKAAVSKSEVTVNQALAKKYHEGFKVIAKTLKLKADFQVESIARLPEVIKVEDTLEINSEEKKALLKALEKASTACDLERAREGKSLKKDLESILNQLETQISEISELREEANKTLQQKFEQKIKSRLAGLEIDPQRLTQEIVMQLEKADINEELSRLKEHLKNYRELYSRSDAQGKKLDFYTQELLREVNTIGSKSNVSKLTSVVVESKTLIERLREQVQNLE